MNRPRLLLSSAASLLLLGSPAAHSAEPRPGLTEQRDDVTHGTFSVNFENDLFTGTDRYYTNGAKIGWTSANLDKFADTPYASAFLPLLNALPFVNDPAYQRNLAFSLGQNIYTPDNTESRTLIEGDRPYAGYLYVGLGLIWKNASVRNSLVLNVGVVGSWSLGEEAQRFIHEARDLAVPQGWGTQLHNEFAGVLVYDRTWRWPQHERRVGVDWEFLPHIGAAVGNVYTYANLGGEMRLGVNLPDDFGTAGIGPEATTSTPVERGQRAERAKKFDIGFYVFARADGRAVAHNIFLDGSTFGNSPSVDKKPLVADLSVGASINYQNTKVTYAVVYRSEEFETQESGQLFGSVSLNWVF